jgi:hypothetical protein
LNEIVKPNAKVLGFLDGNNITVPKNYVKLIATCGLALVAFNKPNGNHYPLFKCTTTFFIKFEVIGFPFISYIMVKQ